MQEQPVPAWPFYFLRDSTLCWFPALHNLSRYRDKHIDTSARTGVPIDAYADKHYKIWYLKAPLQQDHPGIHFNLYSGNADDVADQLDKGLLDFGLLFEPYDIRKYDTLPLPFADTIGFLMQETHPLAQKQSLRMEDVVGVPLIVPSQGLSVSPSAPLMNQDFDPERLNIVCHYNLLFNAAVMVEQGMGIALCLDHLADTTEHTGLTFRPLYPAAMNRLRLAWKKYQIFSPAAELFLRRFRQQFESPDRR